MDQWRNGVGVRCTVGSLGCSLADFADVRRRIARLFFCKQETAYEIMNEPVALFGLQLCDEVAAAA